VIKADTIFGLRIKDKDYLALARLSLLVWSRTKSKVRGCREMNVPTNVSRRILVH
jgi:hypothetical protein